MKLRERTLRKLIREEMGDVTKKMRANGDDYLVVTHNGKEYEIVYSSDFGQSTSVQPYGIVMPGDDVVSFLGKDKRAKRIWKQLKPKVDKFLKVNEGMKKLKEMMDPAFIPSVGTIDTWNLKNMYIKNRTADGILTNAEKKFMKKPDVVVITANRFNTIWTDGKQEFEINTKTNKLVKPLRKARKEIVNHFKNLKYRWKGDTLIFEAKWSDFKHTKGFVHIPLGIKTDSSNSDRKKITVLTNLELNKNKSFQKSFHDFSIYIKEGSLWMMISPAGKRDIREKMKENKNYLRELIDRIKEIIKKNKHIQESKFNHNAAEAFGAYMRGEISVEEVTKIAKQTGKQVATKAELNGFLKNKFMQELMADTYNTPKNLLVKRVKALLQVV